VCELSPSRDAASLLAAESASNSVLNASTLFVELAIHWQDSILAAIVVRGLGAAFGDNGCEKSKS
jgi:hypothetical protein